MSDPTQGAASEAPAAGGGGDALPSAADIMAFDPFGPASDLPEVKAPVEGTTPTPPPADDKGAQSPPAPATPPIKAGEQPPPGTPPAGDPKAPQPAPATPPAPVQPDLTAAIQQQTQAIKEALAAKPAPAPGADQPAPSKYNLGLPPQIINALRSENNDEFAGGMHAIINGMANRIWEDVQAHLTEYVSRTVPAMINSSQESRSTQEQVATDFYGKYPSLKQELLKPLIQQVGLQIVQRRQAAGQPIGWNEQLRDEIAETIFTQLPQLRPAAAPGATPPAPSTPPGGKPPPYSSGGGVRPVPNANTNEFTELLGLT